MWELTRLEIKDWWAIWLLFMFRIFRSAGSISFFSIEFLSCKASCVAAHADQCQTRPSCFVPLPANGALSICCSFYILFFFLLLLLFHSCLQCGSSLCVVFLFAIFCQTPSFIDDTRNSKINACCGVICNHKNYKVRNVINSFHQSGERVSGARLKPIFLLLTMKHFNVSDKTYDMGLYMILIQRS